MGHYEDDYAAEESEVPEQDDQPGDELLDELMIFAMNEVEGPTHMAPLPPTPYMSCSGCRYFSKSMASSGGMRGSPTYFKTCTHPEVSQMGHKGRRSLTVGTGGFGASPHGKEVTPDWCPYLLEGNKQCTQ